MVWPQIDINLISSEYSQSKMAICERTTARYLETPLCGFADTSDIGPRLLSFAQPVQHDVDDGVEVRPRICKGRHQAEDDPVQSNRELPNTFKKANVKRA